MGINIGDLVYQLIMFILLLGMIIAVYFIVVLFLQGQTNQIV